MWKPADNLRWQSESLCSKPSNRESIDWFFSAEAAKKNSAKNMCFQCPVRQQCLQWALEHKQIWGIWGGRDEYEIRRTLSVSYLGEETRRRRYPNCPFCTARTSKLETTVVKLEASGRWNTAKVVTCGECGFSWKSRTSSNAIEAYKTEKTSKKERATKEKNKTKKKIGRPRKNKV